MVSRIRLSDDFRTRFGQLSIAESLAQSVFNTSSLQALAIFVPIPFLASSACGAWRREFFPLHAALVIEHAHDISQQFTTNSSVAFSFCTVVFTNTNGPVRFFKVDEVAAAAGTEKIVGDLQRLLRQPQGRTQFGYVHLGPLSDRYPTTFDFYSEATQILRKEIGNLGEKVSLERIADVLVGLRPCRAEQHDGKGITGFLRIGATDVLADGTVDIDNASIHEGRAVVLNYLQDGDFCIRRVYKSGSGFVVGEYHGDGRQITWGSNVVVVRPKPELSSAQRHVLLSFLRSGLAQRLGNVKQTASTLRGDLMISIDMLKDFPVPVADREIVSAIENLEAARSAFQEWIAEIDAASNAILRESTAIGSRNVILASGQLARQRYRAALQVQDLDYRIRTQYPHPLAYVWREVLVAGPDPYHRLRAILKAAEAHTCFIAQLVILLGRLSEKRIPYLDTLADRLVSSRSGTNFGDWLSIVKEATVSKSLRNIPSGMPLSELRDFGDLWEPAVRRLKKLRDDDSHLRLNSACVPSTLLNESLKDLESIFEATDFLTDYRLVLIVGTKFDSIRRINRYQFRDLSGDNPLAPMAEAQTTRTDLRQDLSTCEIAKTISIFCVPC